MQSTILKISSIIKKFGNIIALNNLSISINKGTIWGLIGPNGAGKTTTINCIADLLNVDSGKIEVFGQDLKNNGINIKRRTGILFENVESLFIYLTGEEHLNFVGDVYGLKKEEKKRRIEELFEFFELNDHRCKLIDEYSKGLKKKIAFASILLYDPEFIVLDEPFDGLDALTVIKIKKLIKSLKEKGKTILITSHILSYIEDITDEVAIINKGEIVFQSATKDIRNKIKNEITNETYQSLEEIFIDLTFEKDKEQKNELSWLK